MRMLHIGFCGFLLSILFTAHLFAGVKIGTFEDKDGEEVVCEFTLIEDSNAIYADYYFSWFKQKQREEKEIVAFLSFYVDSVTKTIFCGQFKVSPNVLEKGIEIKMLEVVFRWFPEWVFNFKRLKVFTNQESYELFERLGFTRLSGLPPEKYMLSQKKDEKECDCYGGMAMQRFSTLVFAESK